MDFFESGEALAPAPASNANVLFVIDYIANVPALLCSGYSDCYGSICLLSLHVLCMATCHGLRIYAYIIYHGYLVSVPYLVF